jgi:hypothetical protein
MPKRKLTKAQLDILRKQARVIHEVSWDHAEEFLDAGIGSVWRVRDNTPGFEPGDWYFWAAPADATKEQVRKKKASRYTGDWEFEVEPVFKRRNRGKPRQPNVAQLKKNLTRIR